MNGQAVNGALTDTPPFLGNESQSQDVDVVVLPVAYELTTSWGEGTANGPFACLEASSQVETWDDDLKIELEGQVEIATRPLLIPKSPNLKGQLLEIAETLSPDLIGSSFPLVLGGEHGLLPAILAGVADHPKISGDLSKLTVIQIDAHADLRDSLLGEKMSHACAARRSLDLGVGRLIQIGVRALSKEERTIIDNDSRVTCFKARNLICPVKDNGWESMLQLLDELNGPVHLSIDIDGLDGPLVPSTGTPVPGGLQYWHVIEIIETLFSSSNNEVISADINEIVGTSSDRLTPFSAALLAVKIVACVQQKGVTKIEQPPLTNPCFRLHALWEMIE